MLNGRRRVLTVIMAAAIVLTVPAIAGAAVAGTAAGAPAAHRNAGDQLAADFRSAQQITRGQGATVAVLSSGVDANALGLGSAVTAGPNYVGSSNSSPLIGTVVAGLIAGQGPSFNDPIAIRGLAPGAHILSIRVYPEPDEPGADRFYHGSRSWQDTLVKGIRYAAAHGASVIYTDSFGEQDWGALESAIGFALAKHAVVVAAAGTPQQGPGSTRLWPADIPGVIAAGTADTAGRGSSRYTLSYPAVSVCGVGIDAGSGPPSQADIAGGQLVAIVTVAAAAALVKAQFPGLSPGLVERAIAVSARHYPGAGSVGIVNPAGALDAAAQLAKVTTTAATSPQALAATDHFGGGPPPTIDAVQHNIYQLAGYAAAVLTGIACLVIALRLRRRAGRSTGHAVAE